MNRRGFSSIYLVLILASFLLFVLTALEAACGYGARSLGQGLCTLTGEAILSEYQRSLWSRYELFALDASSGRLADLADYYLQRGLSASGDRVLALHLASADLSAQAYPALDAEAFSAQLCRAAAGGLAGELARAVGLYESGQEAAASLEEAREIQTQGQIWVETLEELAAGGEGEEEGEEDQERRKQAAALLEQYRAGETLPPEAEGGAALPSGASLEQLPTRLMGVRAGGPAAKGFSLPGAEALLENEYILTHCSNGVQSLEGCFLEGEVEYLLFGLDTDAANRREVQKSLLATRSGLNLASLYAHASLRAQGAALGQALFPFLPPPAAAFFFCSIWSALEGRRDVELLFEGRRVPLFKEPQEWTYSPAALAEGLEPLSAGTDLPPEEEDVPRSFGYYGDYLRLLLAVLPREAKLYRLMDIMQLNIAEEAGEPFLFRYYAYGFDMDLVFQRKMRLPGSGRQALRQGRVEQTFAYR